MEITVESNLSEVMELIEDAAGLTVARDRLAIQNGIARPALKVLLRAYMSPNNYFQDQTGYARGAGRVVNGNARYPAQIYFDPVAYYLAPIAVGTHPGRDNRGRNWDVRLINDNRAAAIKAATIGGRKAWIRLGRKTMRESERLRLKEIRT